MFRFAFLFVRGYVGSWRLPPGRQDEGVFCRVRPVGEQDGEDTANTAQTTGLCSITTKSE
jgi:hypothetical protein